MLKTIYTRPSTLFRRPLPSEVIWRTLYTSNRLFAWIAGLVLILTLFAVTHAEEARSPSVSPAAADVSKIAAWLTSSDASAGVFDRPFGDTKRILDAKDTMFYTDIDDVTVPQGLRRISYDFIQTRMQHLRGGNEGDPAVLITQTVSDDPKEGDFLEVLRRTARKVKGGERYYYVEVAIGNLAWHRMKLAVYEIDGKSKFDFLWSMGS